MSVQYHPCIIPLTPLSPSSPKSPVPPPTTKSTPAPFSVTRGPHAPRAPTRLSAGPRACSTARATNTNWWWGPGGRAYCRKGPDAGKGRTGPRSSA